MILNSISISNFSIQFQFKIFYCCIQYNQKSISWIDIHTVNALIFNSLGPDLIDMTVPVSGNGLEPNQQQAFTIVNVDLAPMS